MCEFIKKDIKCGKKCVHGNFCFTHKSMYLLKDDVIINDRFTNNVKDYLKKDIINTIKYYNLNNILKNKSKEYYFVILKEHLDSLKDYDISKIKIIQKNIRDYKIKKNIKSRGPGFLDRNKCMNDEDFFTYISKIDIKDDYFISYKDKNNSIWCFDVRSLNKLIEMKMSNPYTREPIPDNVIDNVKKIITKIKLENKSYTHDEDIKKERGDSVKQKTIDLFSKIERNGYSCDIKWFLNLNLNLLKKLYRGMEDIWNYRADLSLQVKMEIAPPHGILFNKPINQILNMTSKTELQELILCELNKMNIDNNHLGIIYFLFGLSEVSRECYLVYNWLMS